MDELAIRLVTGAQIYMTCSTERFIKYVPELFQTSVPYTSSWLQVCEHSTRWGCLRVMVKGFLRVPCFDDRYAPGKEEICEAFSECT